MPKQMFGRLTPGALLILSREDPRAFAASRDTRSLKEKRDEVLRQNEDARLSRRIGRTAQAAGSFRDVTHGR